MPVLAYRWSFRCCFPFQGLRCTFGGGSAGAAAGAHICDPETFDCLVFPSFDELDHRTTRVCRFLCFPRSARTYALPLEQNPVLGLLFASRAWGAGPRALLTSTFAGRVSFFTALVKSMTESQQMVEAPPEEEGVLLALREEAASEAVEEPSIPAGPGHTSSVLVLRIRGAQDMERELAFLGTLHGGEFRRLEKKWEEQPELNGAECEYLKLVQSQPTPFGAKRSILLSLFLVVVFVRGCTYWGWNGVQDMLYKSGAFAWRCDPSSPEVDFLQIGDDKYIDCPVRKSNINDLYTTAFASNFIFSAVGGVILDRVGPKLTLLGAILVDGTGWLLLCTASKHFVAYVPALVFIGIASDPGYLSLICIANLFPRRESTVMGVMGSVRSLSFAVPVVMATVYNQASFGPGDLWKVLLFYITLGLGLSLLICLLFVPHKPFLGAEDFRRAARDEEVVAARKRVLLNLPPDFFSPWKTEINPNHQGPLRFKLLLTDAEYAQVQAHLQQVEKREAQVEQEASLKTALANPLFLLLLPVFVVNLLRVEFYTKSNKEQMLLPDGRNLYALFSTMNILSFVPGPLMGYLSDRFGTLCVLTLLNFAGVIMYTLVMPNSLVSKAASVLSFWIYASFVLSSIYCYIKMHFPNKIFGTLAGACSLVGGCFALTSVGWYKLSTETLLSLKPRNFWPVDGGMVAGGLLVGFFLFALRVLEKQKRAVAAATNEKKNTSQDSEQQQPAGLNPVVASQPTAQEGLLLGGGESSEQEKRSRVVGEGGSIELLGSEAVV
ncbi:hypothetical protein Esti_005854 [Eimeria stiedai]